ncbi:MAG: phenylalanine--tRNA ligase subunit beta [Clostridia bacterium]|jgi:phenylalanyl-tRNA synthetase beta chain
MLVPLKWLKRYTDIDIPVKEFIDRMTMTGSNVEGYESLGKDISRVVVGKIIKTEKHPDADKLLVCQVDVGNETLQIVTGASNIFVGALVPVALHGSQLPGNIRIKRGKLRGVESQGMLCSGEELLLNEEDYPGAGEHGILILKEDYPLGLDIKDVFGLNDVVIDFEITSNRPDCLSMVGLAREAAATFEKEFRFPEIKIVENNESIQQYGQVEVWDKDLCPRYMAKVVKNVKVGTSPLWLRQYLRAAGVRPINNIVDVTNFVMLEMGQPLHAYDLAKVSNNKIIVRRAKQGETLTTLDGRDRILNPEMLLIADDTGPIGLAGIMGGENTEIEANTQVVLLESASFEAGNIRMTSKAMGLRTEASIRFEKGLDINNVETALNRAAQLIHELGAGENVGGVIDVSSCSFDEKTISFSWKKVNSLLGLSLKPQEMVRILNRLFITTSFDEGSEMLHAVIPSFRRDIEGVADIAEEVLRIYGYDKIPATYMKGSVLRGKRNEKQKLYGRIKSLLTGIGFYEATTYSFMSPKTFDCLGLPSDSPLRDAVQILNPLGEDQSLMKTTLVPGMLEVLSTNLNRKLTELSLFEVNKVYKPSANPEEELPFEKDHIVLGMSGEDVDFFTLKGVIEAVLEYLGISEVDFLAEASTFFHPGRKATVYADKMAVGMFGEIHPDVAEAFNIPERVYVAEFDLELLQQKAHLVRSYKPLPKYPAIARDLAVIVGNEIPVGALQKTIHEEAGEILESVELFDIYKGKQVPENHKSVAFSLIYRGLDRTLTDEEVNLIHGRVVQKLQEKYQAILR